MPEGNKKHDGEGYKKSSDCLLKSKHEPNSIKNVIGVVSGKGGVGKSLITSMTYEALRHKVKNEY